MLNIYSGKRIFYFDILRVIAILSIILCHSTRMFGLHNYSNLISAIPGLLNIVGTVGVPIFFMISGALLLNREYTLKDFFKKRFSRILYPAFFWISITIIGIYLFFKPESIFKLIFGIDRYTWFIWVMIGIYLFVPVINSFIREYGLKGVEYFLLIWIITICLQTFYSYPFYKLELSYFAGYIGYVVLGYYLANKDLKLNKLVLAFLGFVLFFVFTIAHMIISYYQISYISIDNLSITSVLASTGMFLMIRYLTQYFESKGCKTYEKIKNGKVGELIFLISTCSYGMYFANSFVIRIIKLFDIHSIKFLPLTYIILVVSSFLMVLILSKIPILKKFSGAG